jgi:fructose-bisphosphate aldolase class II
MPHVNSKEILSEARERRYGVPGLVGGNLEMVIGQIAAAEERRSPLVLVFNQEVTVNVPMELGMRLIVNAAEKANVPVATILDHGQSLESIVRAIRFGSSSVMFDGSSLPYEENVGKAKEVVRIAHAAGVCVEAELGSIVGSAVDPEDSGPEAAFTDPEMAAEFVDKTGVDALAISFGNVHGMYRGNPNLDLERVRRIHSMVDVPLVMHGGSGLAESDYARIVESGVSKVCYYTAMARGASVAIKEMMLDAGHDDIIYHHIISRTIDYFYTETRKLLDVLGCSGVIGMSSL